VAYANLCGFFFGYHVHEKAALAAVLPLTWAAVADAGHARTYLVANAAALYGLLPLLYRPEEYGLKVAIAFGFQALAWWALAALHAPGRSGGGGGGSKKSGGRPLLSALEAGYVLAAVPLELALSWGLPAVGGDARLPFLPLLLTSLYVALGMGYAWARMCAGFVAEARGFGGGGRGGGRHKKGE
jgi:alpha-1,3-glucosyltransferase